MKIKTLKQGKTEYDEIKQLEKYAENACEEILVEEEEYDRDMN